jgi:hypothetical protein
MKYLPARSRLARYNNTSHMCNTSHMGGSGRDRAPARRSPVAVGPTVTLVIDHGTAMTPTPDPVADALLHAVALGIMSWTSVRLFWHLGRRRAALRRSAA